MFSSSCKIYDSSMDKERRKQSTPTFTQMHWPFLNRQNIMVVFLAQGQVTLSLKHCKHVFFSKTCIFSIWCQYSDVPEIGIAMSKPTWISPCLKPSRVVKNKQQQSVRVDIRFFATLKTGKNFWIN